MQIGPVGVAQPGTLEAAHRFGPVLGIDGSLAGGAVGVPRGQVGIGLVGRGAGRSVRRPRAPRSVPRRQTCVRTGSSTRERARARQFGARGIGFLGQLDELALVLGGIRAIARHLGRARRAHGLRRVEQDRQGPQRRGVGVYDGVIANDDLAAQPANEPAV